MDKIETKNNIEVNGAFISPQIASELKWYQDYDNSTLDEFEKHISDAICLLVFLEEFCNNPDCLPKMHTAARRLTFVRDSLDKFHSPDSKKEFEEDK